MSVLAPVRKAIVPVAVAVALIVLGKLGVVETPQLVEQITLVITAVLVYLIPNN